MGGVNMKNNQHSFLVKELKRLREQVNWHLISLKVAKGNLTACFYNPYNTYKHRYISEVKECRQMLESLSDEIRETKKEIYRSQLNFNTKAIDEEGERTKCKCDL